MVTGGMSWKDAASTALVSALVAFFTVFMALWGYEAVMNDTGKFAYDAIVFLGGTWITTFASLVGITAYKASKK